MGELLGILNNDYPEYAEKTLTSIERLLASGSSKFKIANEAEISIEALEHVLNRGWLGQEIDGWNPKEILDKLQIWLSNLRQPIQTEWARTNTYEAVEQKCLQAHKQKILSIMVGDVGMGKSVASINIAAAYPKTTRTPGFIYLQLDESHAKPLAFLMALYEALPGSRSGIAQRIEVLIRAVSSLLVWGDVIILDESNKLFQPVRGAREARTLQVIRDLYEKSNASFVLLGNPVFRKHWSNAEDDLHASISRARYGDLGHTTIEDVDIWFEWKGLSGKKLRDACVKLAARPGPRGGLRNLEILIDQINYDGLEFTSDVLIDTAYTMNRQPDE